MMDEGVRASFMNRFSIHDGEEAKGEEVDQAALQRRGELSRDMHDPFYILEKLQAVPGRYVSKTSEPNKGALSRCMSPS